MLRSWLILLASDNGSGTPSSGTPAQEAVWPCEAVTSLSSPSVKKDEDDKALKIWETGVRKTAFRPESETRYDGGERMAAYCEDKPAYQAVETWSMERGEPCLV